ncbi:Putative Zinc finger, PHD-type, Zinc finger, FYVE/PHD-type, Zinc finger, RING/FYVE/PHD-type [Septoria linicola]|uniref:Zinc finger, PHD-type, Zinc finger, FYVE/PHD-type, Zinc finger, RING/FYVE/PHD-type n=1 Tax=Septoria linicola TaxID=215465 RepID=A0A9Q9AL02_9PEZI|nr:Putative Zinc finger, PHD-type, Zinc finger, FYVE/PHD-type, Zinc finger, RING/FYVE/PHD-type [Septoria linicola]
MPRYKRTAEAAQLDVAPEPAIAPEAQEMLTTLRNMWEFASLMQYIFLFGHVVKIDDSLDIEDLEHECLQPTPSEKLAHIGLQLLKYVSSHRGLTPEIFDEYTRRQYLAKAPQRNPFGDEEEPTRFNDLDIYTRVKVLQQLSVWTLGNAERIRGMMPQEEDHLGWRIEPLGWDKEDRSYYVLDDNRLYRRTDEPLPPLTPKPKPKAKAKKSSKSKAKPPTRGTRTSKRRKVEESEEEELDDENEADDTAMDNTLMTNGDETMRDDVEDTGYGFTKRTWELVAITLEEYQDFMASIFRSRDPNEKQLRARIETDVLPIIEKRAEALRAKQMKKLRELENLSKMATAKRSSRLADKADKEAEAQKEREAQEQRQRELKMAREEQERQKRIEEGHESRRLTREQRVREREAKRIIHEEELARLEAEGDRAVSQDVELEDVDGDVKRASGRQRQTQREQHKKELEKLAEEDGNWYFDCSVCGQHGENMDDGSHSIACDRCNVWQHSKCHGYTPKQAEQETFVFICGTCKRKEEDAKKPKIPPLKLHNRSSDSPENHKAGSRPSTANGQLPHAHHAGGSNLGAGVAHSNGQQATPHASVQVPQGQGYPPVSNFAARPAYPLQNSSSPPRAYAQPLPPMQTGYSQQAPSHLQQHHYAHISAITNAGGHPQSAQQHNQAYAYGQHATSYQQQPQQQYQHVHAHQQWQQHHQPSNNAQAQQRPGSSQLMNGFQSPDKATIKATSSSPPQQRPASTHNAQPQQHYQQPQQIPSNHYSPHMQRSPNLAPPERQPLQHSPVKSSPSQTTPRLSQNSQTLQHVPPVANGHQAPYQNSHMRTPQTQQPHTNGAGASPHATQVAADGMTGPWPAGSNHIPQKHDQAQSPAPPPSAQSVGDRKIFPPATPLVPSPGHQSSTSSVPVKKMQLSPVMSSAPSVSTPPVLPPPAPMQPQVQPEPQPPPVQAQPGALHEQQH